VEWFEPYAIFHGSSLFSAGVFSLGPEGLGSDPQMKQISTDVFTGSTLLRNLRIVPNFHSRF